MLRNLNQSSSGQRVCGTPKSGVLGSLIPATGDNGAGYTYNDLSLPADNAKEICGRITTWPSSGTLTAYEDTSFEFSGAPDGSYSFAYQLYVDGVSVGSPNAVTLTVGVVPAQITVTTDSPSFSINASTSASAIFNILIDDAIFTGGAFVTGAVNQANFAVTTDNAVFAGSAEVTGLFVSALLSAVTEEAVFNGGAYVVGTPITVAFSVTTDNTEFTGSAVASAGTFSGSLSDTDVNRIAAAVLAIIRANPLVVYGNWPTAVQNANAVVVAMNTGPKDVNVVKVNGITVVGDGTRALPWRPA